MNTHKYLAATILFTLAFGLGPAFGVAPQGAARPASKREEAYKYNNLGVALLEQFKYADAAGTFRRALAADPSLGVARLNLALALHYASDDPGALVEARAAATALPNAPQPHYLIGLIAKAANRPDEAIAAFTKVLAIDPKDVGTNLSLGQVYAQQRRYDEAVASFRAAVAIEPYNATALYNLANTLIRAGKREEGQPFMQHFQKLRESGAATTFGTAYFEQGAYAEAIISTGKEPDLVDRAVPESGFVDATAAMLPAATAPAAKHPGGLALFDPDGDGDLDLLDVSPAGSRLLRNDGGKFAAWEALPAQANGLYGVAGDYDNDGRPDLFVARAGGLALLHNAGGGKFTDATAAAKLPAYAFVSGAGAFVDADHDGDLDVFVAGHSDPAKPATGAPSLLLRNNGDGTFADGTETAKVGASAVSVGVVPTDFDNRRDVDLIVAREGAPPTLFRNLRDGSFADMGADVGLTAAGRFGCVAAGDVNKDGYTDFFFGEAAGDGQFALSTGKGGFTMKPGPSGASAAAAQFLDYDGDGLLDLVTLASGGLRVWRNVGSEWTDTTSRAVGKDIVGGVAFASGDLDGDGDTDLVLKSASGETKVARNDGGKNRSFRVALTAKVSNRSGVGAKVEMRAGSLWQKLETYSASPAPAPSDVVFGLGARTVPDAVRVLWPAGIVQAETEIPAAAATAAARPPLKVEEVDRKPSSCPFLYTWNGERFEFVTDFMGPGEMGYWVSPEIRSLPDTDEYVRVRGDQLVERGGRYELRVTNELEEVLYLDHVKLLAVAHPADVEVYPNEGMAHVAPEFKVFTTKGARLPVSAVDDRGVDMLDRVARLDRTFADGFALLPLRGYAERHALTLDLGEPADRTVLLLTGWTDYAFSSDNVAAWQRGLQLEFPSLQVRDPNGEWVTVVETLGIPVGRPQTVPVDLTGKFLSASREVRIVTNMRVYWDQILVDTSAGDAPTRVERAPLVSADLRWRGYSRLTSPDGKEPFGYDYDAVTPDSPWKVAPGRYTREGSVGPLLRRVDDVYVISRTGDETVLSFDASALGRLPKGWKRTFLFYADGFSKEMDINSSSPDQVAPLPFHGMKSYPYEAPEAYPMTPARRRYLERYNTRVVGRPVPKL